MGVEQRVSLDEVELGTRVARELDLVGHRREFRFAGVRVVGRRRRPSGEKAPSTVFVLPTSTARSIFWLLCNSVPAPSKYDKRQCL